MQNVSNGNSSGSSGSGGGGGGGGGNGASGAGGKRPKKGILKTSSSFDRTGASCRKSAKFDELNVLQTFHPADKDYGHMKIDEPKTPYSLDEPDEERDHLDAELLAEKLRIAANTQTSSFDDENEVTDEEFEETPEEKARRLEFERRRKAHYKEFEAVKLARKLIEEELANVNDDDEDGNDVEHQSTSVEKTYPSQALSSDAASQSQEEQNCHCRQMDVDQQVGRDKS